MNFITRLKCFFGFHRIDHWMVSDTAMAGRCVHCRKLVVVYYL